MTKLIIVRHGQSEGNLRRAFLGHTDLDLTDKGRKQAELTAEYLQGTRIDAAYSSDLKRAYFTCKAIADRQGLDIKTDADLREIYAGKWENVEFTEIQNTYVKDYGIWLTDIGNARCTGGESVKEVSERACGALKRIINDNDGKTVLIASHATPIRTMITMMKGLDASEAAKVEWVQNSSVTIVNTENGSFDIELLGYEGHLGNMRSKLPKNV